MKKKKASLFKPRERQVKTQPAPFIYGLHSVRAALDNPNRAITCLYCTQNALEKLKKTGPLPLEPTIVDQRKISRLLPPETVHQGALAEASPLPEYSLEQLPEDAFVVMLDHVTDPHNLGAILRSACAFGINALITTHYHSADLNGTVLKAASGAAEHVPIIAVKNLTRAISELSEKNFSIIGLDSDAEKTLLDLPVRRPLALLLGAEGKGLRQSTRESCHYLARLALPGPIKSLNVSNAAVLAFHIFSPKT